MKRFLLEYLPAWLLLMVFGFIVIHAPLTVWVGTQWPQLALAVKAWKELMIALASLLIVVAMYDKRVLKDFIARPIVAIAAVYAALHVLMVGMYPQGLQPTIAGLMIDLRYVLYFVAAYGFLSLYPQYRQSFVRVGVVGAAIVVGFTVMQLFLPKETLMILGYGDSTIQPYMTVDKNPDFIRYSSTLRGPNPLGAYAVMALAGVVAYVFKGRRGNRSRLAPWVLFGGFAATVVALWVSYSRSALVGAVIAVAIILVAAADRRMNKANWLIAGVAVLFLAGALYAVKDTTFIQNVILHNNPTTGAELDSNAAHADSLAQGLARMAVQPLGAGVGSTGSASLLANNGLIIENQYLMIAHEVGWMGLGLFVLLFGMILRGLWAGRKDWLALSVFASGIGLAIIGLLLPVWADDTVSIVWWGLVAISLCYKQHTLTRDTRNYKI